MLFSAHYDRGIFNESSRAQNRPAYVPRRNFLVLFILIAVARQQFALCFEVSRLLKVIALCLDFVWETLLSEMLVCNPALREIFQLLFHIVTVTWSEKIVWLHVHLPHTNLTFSMLFFIVLHSMALANVSPSVVDLANFNVCCNSGSCTSSAKTSTVVFSIMSFITE